GDIEGAVGSSRQSGGPEFGASRLLYCACEAVGEHNKISRSFAAGHGLEHHVVATLRSGRAVPRPVECDEGARPVGCWEFAVGDEQQVIRSPVRREEGRGRTSLRTQTDCLAAIAAVLGREDELLLEAVEVTLRPAIVGTALQLHD